MGDDVCGDAFFAQAEWSHYCEECMDQGMSAEECSVNDLNLDCTVLEGTGSDMYLQYYCWQDEDNCNDKVGDLLECIIQSCSDCEDDLDGGDTKGKMEEPVEEHEEDNSAAMCNCLFDGCWESVEACFFQENCWKLIFGDEEGYGLDYMFNSTFNTGEGEIPAFPTLADQRIRTIYCADKDCNDEFWNVWYCIWPPIPLGETYGCNAFWDGKSSGCGLGEEVYRSFLPSCIADDCMGFADDCLSYPDSECYTTFIDSFDDIQLCSFCDDDDSDCLDTCLTSTQFKSAYIENCGDDGSLCSVTYNNLANCLYTQCADGEEALPGSVPMDTACPTTTEGEEATNGVVMQSGVLALILSSVLAVLSL
jgi:hypothetical protein